MSDTILLAPTTAAATSEEFIVKPGFPKTVYLYPLADLTAGEYANLQRKDPAETWQDVYDHSWKGGGGQVRLDTTVSGIMVAGEGTYRIELEDPTNAIGVGIGNTFQD